MNEKGQIDITPIQKSSLNEGCFDFTHDSSIIQLQQILKFLKKRQQELDRRESVFNAQIANFELEMRKITETIQLTKEELQNQKTELTRQTQEFELEKKEFQQTKQMFYEQSKRVLDELTAKNKDNLAV